MKTTAIVEGTPVMLRETAVLDEHGNEWTHGAGPFVVARIYRTPGYKTPWLRLYSAKGSAAAELPGDFRPKELRSLTTKEARAFYGLGA